MRISATLTTIAAVVALAACAQQNDRYGRLLTPTANPSALVATELAFARAAREDGQWTAFRKYAADDAVMFVPQPVNAKDWLKQQDDPAEPVQWQPHEIWSSCDGSLAVAKGAWQRPDGSQGYFTTVWRRERKGDYEWVLDQGDVLAQPLAAPEFIRTNVADCPPGGPKRGPAATGQGAPANTSDDGTLAYAWNVEDDNSTRHLSVTMRIDGAMRPVLTSDVTLSPQ